MAACTAVVGCDGVDSAVRAKLGIGWPGGTYRREVVLADLDLAARGAAALESGTAHVVAGSRGLLFLFPLGERATWRLLATRPVCPDLPLAGRPGPAVPADELQQLIDDAGLSAHDHPRGLVEPRTAAAPDRRPVPARAKSSWPATPRTPPHRPADTGMNAGIQDAANLGWKLALRRVTAASRGRCSPPTSPNAARWRSRCWR